MKNPSEEQINIVISLMELSLKELLTQDLNILINELKNPISLNDEEKKLDRKLHEITINHRLAVYIEKYINSVMPDFKVDLEYNRFYQNHKKVQTEEGLIEARPDILVHKRVNIDELQHFIAVECKKGKISEHDIIKIKGLISDENYNYLFGITISYSEILTDKKYTLYFFDGNEIINIEKTF